MERTKSSAPVEEQAKIAAMEDRYRNELMGEEERLELRERILRLRRGRKTAGRP